MMQNLRNVLTRGGRSMGSRNFSSPPGSPNDGWERMARFAQRERPSKRYLVCALFGYAYYIVSGDMEIKKIAQADEELLQLRVKRHQELVHKAMRDLELIRSRD
ncbi:uncharacterized protein LOC111831483 [Capsella rubella]|uniref:uncharacterized protein LOC111831483 n=1 Tax=Capsella rubella TaxID=81985 RepID=UPI000CD4D331|nr:uncharacterized protein LOC111831483 [Capsella rubella]